MNIGINQRVMQGTIGVIHPIDFESHYEDSNKGRKKKEYQYSTLKPERCTALCERCTECPLVDCNYKYWE